MTPTPDTIGKGIYHLENVVGLEQQEKMTPFFKGMKCPNCGNPSILIRPIPKNSFIFCGDFLVDCRACGADIWGELPPGWDK